VRDAGGRVLLTGVGGDELLTGTMFFFADWLAHGRVWSAVCEMIRRAAIGRVSFWELAYRNALLPLLPASVQHRLVKDQGQLPPWILRSAVRRHDLRGRTFALSSYAGPIGRKHHHAITTHLVALGSVMEYGVIEDDLDVRHPFLYRPLVEFALRLAAEVCAKPYAHKWVLREAMRGILPEAVRTRIGKGSPAEVYASALTTQRKLLEPLARDSMLADLGVVDATRLYAAFNDLPFQPHRRDEQHAMLHATLLTEAWLQIRSGRWPREGQFGSVKSAGK
jgi:asparagine synthase (glutamine-hydrolysing)